MMIDHSAGGRGSRVLFWPALIATLTVMAALNWISSPLITEQAAMGIISYEFAGSFERAQTILASWNQSGLLRAAFALGLDYLFMPLYAFTIGAACRWTGAVLTTRGWPFAPLAGVLAWAQVLAAVLDGIENAALIGLLIGYGWRFAPAVAAICAGIKFALVFLGLVYTFFGLVVRVVIRQPVS